MSSIIRSQLSSCECCKLCKYERHPNRPDLQPTQVGNWREFVRNTPLSHFYPKNMVFLSYKTFSLEIQIFSAIARTFGGDTSLLFGLYHNGLQQWERLVMSHCFELFENIRYEAILYADSKKWSQWQIERFHSTFLETYRCLKSEHPNLKCTDLVPIAWLSTYMWIYFLIALLGLTTSS